MGEWLYGWVTGKGWVSCVSGTAPQPSTNPPPTNPHNAWDLFVSVIMSFAEGLRSIGVSPSSCRGSTVTPISVIWAASWELCCSKASICIVQTGGCFFVANACARYNNRRGLRQYTI